MSQKILIVDDAPDILKVAEFILKKEGYDVSIAENGQEAVDVAREVKPNLILLDLHLPVLDGTDACKQIKADESLNNTPVIFLTGSDLELIAQKIEETKADGFIKKPFTADEIKQKVLEYLK